MSQRIIRYRKYPKNLGASLYPNINGSSIAKIQFAQNECNGSVLTLNVSKASRSYHTAQRGFVAHKSHNCRASSSLSNGLRMMSTVAETKSPVLPDAEMFKCKTTVEILAKASEVYATNNLFGTRKGDRFEWLTYAEFGKLVEETRKVLAGQGIGVNDKVALICNNRVEWAAFMYATQGIGGQIVPM